MRKLNSVHLVLTYRCLSACEHCFRFSDPRARQVVTRSQLRRYLEQIARLPTVEWVFFEGGEPTLYWPLLVEGIRLAHDLGLHTGLVTSGYWITSLKDMVAYVKALRAAHLDLLQVSVDALHGNLRLEPLQSDMVELARRAGMACQFLSVTVPPPDEEPVEARRGAMITGGWVAFRGRAAHGLVREQALWDWESLDECPHERLADPFRIHVDPYGHVQICEGISIGNLEKMPLEAVLDGFHPTEHPIVGPLLEGGPAGLVRHHGLPHAKGYADACHLCYSARRRLRQQGLLGDILVPGQVYGEASHRSRGRGGSRSQDGRE